MINREDNGFFDLLLNFVLAITGCFILAFLLIKVQTNEADVKKTKAEFLITLTWQENIDHDVDLWIRDPNGEITFYRDKETGITHLDRDDLGMKNDVYTENGEIKYIPTNQEIATIRGFLAGEWVVNLHFYGIDKAFNADKIAHCNVIVTKLNPKVKIILNKKIEMEQYWQEKTVARLTMSVGGEILNIDEDFPVKLVESKIYMQ